MGPEAGALGAMHRPALSLQSHCIWSLGAREGLSSGRRVKGAVTQHVRLCGTQHRSVLPTHLPWLPAPSYPHTSSEQPLEQHSACSSESTAPYRARCPRKGRAGLGENCLSHANTCHWEWPSWSGSLTLGPIQSTAQVRFAGTVSSEHHYSGWHCPKPAQPTLVLTCHSQCSNHPRLQSLPQCPLPRMGLPPAQGSRPLLPKKSCAPAPTGRLPLHLAQQWVIQQSVHWEFPGSYQLVTISVLVVLV